MKMFMIAGNSHLCRQCLHVRILESPKVMELHGSCVINLQVYCLAIMSVDDANDTILLCKNEKKFIILSILLMP